MSSNLVVTKQLSYSHEPKKLVFQDINLSIPKGKIIAILGPSGTGKTTLLKLIGGQIRPQQGEIHVFGQNIHNCSQINLYKIRKKIGMLFQGGGLFTHLTIFENVAFPLREHTDLTEGMINTLVLMKLQMVGLRGASALYPSQLSGGMARRIALARAIALDPELIMYDEPFTGQDPISLGILAKLIHHLNKALGLTTIIVSHDVQETLNISDYVYVMVGKKIIAEGTPEDLRSNSAEQLNQFIKGEPDGPIAFDYPAPPLAKQFLEIE